MTRRSVVLGLALALAAASVPAHAAGRGRRADTDAGREYFVEVLVLHATNSGKGIDERIGDLPELRKPPFSSYDSYELLQAERLPLVVGEPRELRLPNDRVLRTSLVAVLPRETLRIAASINQPKGKTFLPLLEVKAKVGQRFIVAGQKYRAGILVLVFRVTR
ncbi:MAG: hypothetical protein IT376_06420 [Polyangiaceae bacterium]|nr:hypothetical protein [Polyangiaceae bacterium]